MIILFLTFALIFSNMFAQADSTIQRRMVVVIASYNNACWYEGNLRSVFDQDYDNYRVIYINDCSSDGTGYLVESLINECNQGHRVTLINNVERRRALRNLYDAIVSCDDDEIIVLLDGDDMFYGRHVLQYLNSIYADPDIWITFGQCVMFPFYQTGYSCEIPPEVIEGNSIRFHQPQPSHLRTFYAKLFKLIAVEDLMHGGDFFSMTYDLAMMMPMMEMAGYHHKFISDILYIYNDANPINDHKVSKALQHRLDQEIRSRKPYQKIVSLF